MAALVILNRNLQIWFTYFHVTQLLEIDYGMVVVKEKRNLNKKDPNKKKWSCKNECQQHPVFPGGHPSKY